MKYVREYRSPSQEQKLMEQQAALAVGYKNRLPLSDTKLVQDLEDIFENYDPDIHIVGIKATYNHEHDFKDKTTKTVKYVAGNVVTDPKDFDSAPVCGGGLHFSFAHSPQSIRASLMAGVEKGSRFHIALIDVDDAVVVEGTKVKTPSAEIVFTGSFKDCHRLLQPLFGTLGTNPAYLVAP